MRKRCHSSSSLSESSTLLRVEGRSAYTDEPILASNICIHTSQHHSIVPSSAALRFFFLSATFSPTASGGATNASSLSALLVAARLFCRSSRLRFSIASFSCGLRKYSPEASWRSSFDGC